MNQLQEQRGIIDRFFKELDELSSADFGQRISVFTDEQPHLSGFLFNLDEDFSESDHDRILKTAIVVRDVLVGAGAPLEMVNNEIIEQVIGEKVEQYDLLGEEEYPIQKYVDMASSPQMFASILANNAGANENLYLITDVIISVLEESAVRMNKDQNKGG